MQAYLGLSGLKKFDGAQEKAILRSMLAKVATKHSAWRTFIKKAVHDFEPTSVLVLQSPEARLLAETASRYAGSDIDILTPIAFTKSVNRYQTIYCPVCPDSLDKDFLTKVYQANEFHMLDSYDEPQKEIFRRLGHHPTRPKSKGVAVHVVGRRAARLPV